MNPEEEKIQTEIIQSLGGSVELQPSMEVFRVRLAVYLNDLINQDFEKLVQLLYRLDVSEKKLKALLSQNNQADAGRIIADLIIERQLQKVELRKKFRKQDDISEEEKW